MIEGNSGSKLKQKLPAPISWDSDIKTDVAIVCCIFINDNSFCLLRHFLHVLMSFFKFQFFSILKQISLSIFTYYLLVS